MTDEGAVFISVLPDSGIACHTLKREKWERDRQVGREGGRECGGFGFVFESV